jgi:transketolase
MAGPGGAVSFMGPPEVSRIHRRAVPLAVPRVEPLTPGGSARYARLFPKKTAARGLTEGAMPADHATLATMAQKLRRHSLESTAEAGSGHPTSCMSAAEVMSVLFFDEMRFDPRDPSGRDADVFVLSKGHAAPMLWAALKEAGAIDHDLASLRRFDSPLEGHPTPRLPWVRVATGSLGQGLSAAAGMAWARRHEGTPARVYTLLGDGEAAEGAVWEAAQFASFYALDNLCAIVDVNRLGQSGPTMYQHDTAVYEARLRAFGWEAAVVDGHDVAALRDAFGRARETKGRPFGIVARTFKGKGVSFLEDKEGWHGKPVKKGDELARAVAELGDTSVTIRVEPRRYAPAPARPAPAPSLTPEYSLGQEVATREAYGTALAKLARTSPQIVALDGDTKNSTFSERLKEVDPRRHVESYIAEQNMVGAALGMATEGRIPFASTFACFLSRAYDFIRMAGYSMPPHLVLCGSHAGVSIGEDGPSQMALEDLAMMRAVTGATVLYPSDAVSAERLVETAARTPGIVYIRTSRPKTKVIYPNGEAFPVGGSKTLRSSGGDAVTLVAAGVTVPEALAAHDALAKEGVSARVIDLYSVKPLDAAALEKAARETRGFVCVEDHSVCGGIGDAVASAVAGRARVEILGIREMPRSGKPAELMKAHGITADAIAAAARRLLG